EPLVPHDVRKAIETLPQAQIPLVRQYMTRRIVAVHEADGSQPAKDSWILGEVFGTLGKATDAVRLDMLRGLDEAYAGRRSVTAPANWNECYAALAKSTNQSVRDEAVELAVLFGDREQMAHLEQVVLKQVSTNVDARRRAVALLTAKREPEFGRK